MIVLWEYSGNTIYICIIYIYILCMLYVNPPKTYISSKFSRIYSVFLDILDSKT